MKQSTFKKLLLIVTFAIFTITSVAGFITKWGYEIPDKCEMCGCEFPVEPEIDTWTDQVTFQIHTYICPKCGYWIVRYVYPIPEV